MKHRQFRSLGGKLAGFAVSSSLMLGCTGHIDSDPANQQAVESPGEVPTGEDVPGFGDGEKPTDPVFHFRMREAATFPGLRMMTTAELTQTTLDLTGVTVDTSSYPDALSLYNLKNDATRLTVRDVQHMRKLFELAHDVALRTDVDQTLPCAAEPCQEAELRAFLERAFNFNPDAELSTYVDIYQVQLPDKGHDFARRAVIQTALLSPFFLYRTEIGDGTGALTGPELAQKLSYFLWGTAPDGELRDAGLTDALRDPATYDAQVNRMLSDPRVNSQVTRFIFEWLGLDHVDLSAKSNFAELPSGMESSMRAEVEMLIGDLLERDAPLSELFDTQNTFVDENLAGLYGISGITGTELQSASLAGTQRRGILTTALVLAAHGKEDGRSPMQRGHFLINEVMCYGFPPEAGVPTMELPDGEDLTFRQRFEPLGVVQPCMYCHRTLNAGFAFDIFDPVGRQWPETNVPLSDTAGFFELAPFGRLEFGSTGEAVAGFATHDAVPQCFTAQAYRYMQGRLPGTQDRETLKGLIDGFRTDQRIVNLLGSIVRSELFKSVLPPGGAL